MSEMSTDASKTRKLPLTARQAMSISLGGLAIGAVVLLVAYTLFFVPFRQALIWYAIGAFFLLAFPWASINWETRNRAIRAHNRFVYFTIAMVAVAVVVQRNTEGESFPKWAIAAIIAAGVVAYSVMARHALANFQKWRHGKFESLHAGKT